MAVGGQDVIKTGTTPPSAPTGYASLWIDGTTKRANLIDDAGLVSDLHAGIYKITGSLASPIVITAAGGINPGGYYKELIYLKSAGGAVAITRDPSIALGTIIGQEITLVGTSAVDYIGIPTDTGVDGPGTISTQSAAGRYFVATYIWLGAKWVRYV